MSYEIVYDKQFIELTPDVVEGQKWYIPVILHGSNNCTEVHLITGKERRERYWSSLYFSGENQLPWLSETEIMNKIESYLGGYGEHFMVNNKWVDDDGLIKFFKNGIRGAKTVEEIVKMGVKVKVYISKWDGDKKTVILNEYISNSDALKDWLLRAKLELRNRGNSNCYVNIRYTSTKLDKSILRQALPELEHYFVLKDLDKSKNSNVYIERSTAKRILYTYRVEEARKFKSHKLAEDWITGIRNRGYNRGIEIIEIGKEFA